METENGITDVTKRQNSERRKILGTNSLKFERFKKIQNLVVFVLTDNDASMALIFDVTCARTLAFSSFFIHQSLNVTLP